MKRASYLPFALPDLDHDELAEVTEVLSSGWLTTGPKVRQFESDFAAFVGCRHAVALNSCTAAMHLALEACGLQPGDEVITSPYTFAATAEVVRYFDARPVLVDIDQKTFNIRPDQIGRAITPRTRAIIPVHVGGLAADLDAIYAVAAERGLAVIEDAAHALPSRCGGRMVGQQVRPDVRSAICYSFYATKTLTTGEGGMLCTDDANLADRARIMALHGISRNAWNRYTAEGSWYYEILAPGFKYNMTDIMAAIGLAQLRKVEAMWRRRCQIAARFTEAFQLHPELETPANGAAGQHAWHLYMLRLNLDRLRIDRSRFMEELKARNIGASVHFIPLHIHPYYRETYGYAEEDLPIAAAEYRREISLPIYSRMSDQDIEDVVEAVSEITECYRA